MKPSDINGEVDWFAIDSSGFIALMCSAGFGPVPDLVFQQWDRQRRIEEYLIKRSGYSPTGGWQRMIWTLSLTGVFFYDWKHWEGPYRRLGFPLLPRRVDRLGFPPELRDAFITVPKHFFISRKLRPELLSPCTS
jgi:hypothetical protein